MTKKLEGEYTQACLEKEKRPDLLLVVKHYYLDVPTAGNSQYQTKADIIKSIMFYWANHYVLDSGVLDRLERSLESPTAVPYCKGMTTQQLAWEKEKLKMQLKVQLEQQECQRAHDLKQQEMVLKQQCEQRTHELEMLKLKLDSEKSRPKHVGMFDPAKSLRLMPSFNEDSVEEFFRCFEKVALALKWPKESWVIVV